MTRAIVVVVRWLALLTGMGQNMYLYVCEWCTVLPEQFKDLHKDYLFGRADPGNSTDLLDLESSRNQSD